ncbi:PepSY domain-containing protein [Paenibacillus sp. YYML68]|uniref:PepSY-associated TM helix domain-containing protein n=1 Tax=Paenibacillus sp. YYML68 TaxID=2909250 RepID=UPI002493497C|nr:PepSY domain-containing protein [Paenibacillus sp. YYML68]
MEQSHVNQEQPTPKLYRMVWRWHFYAGLLFAPILIILAVTGAVYLFKPQYEAWQYKDYMHVQAAGDKLSASEQVARVKTHYPDASVTRFKPGAEPELASVVGIVRQGEPVTVFVNPYSGAVTGEVADNHTFMKLVKTLHGSIMMGTTGNRIIELAAGWGMILLVTGLYLWWPRSGNKVMGVWLPRLNQGKRIFWRDLHAVPAMWMAVGVALLIMTGLPWSGVWGDGLSKFSAATGTGTPALLFMKPQSAMPTKDVAEVPWAAEQLPVPTSDRAAASTNTGHDGHAPTSGQAKSAGDHHGEHGGATGASTGSTGKPLAPVVPLEDIVKLAEEQRFQEPYTVTLPKGELGVYTIAVNASVPENGATLHIDQYSGNVLADLRFADYGILGKMVSIGIALHEGRYFGTANQIICLLLCLGLILTSVTGAVMWWRRRPAGKLGAPAAQRGGRVLKGTAVIVAAFGIFFPLVGLSILAALLIDVLLVQRVGAVKRYLGA